MNPPRDHSSAHPRLREFLVALICLIGFGSLTAGFGADTNNVLLFSFFRGNGDDGLYLATSTNGLHWTELKPRGKSFLEPGVGGKIMRDPCLRLGPDGMFHLVWTTSWGRPSVFGLAHSRDLIHWSAPQAVPVMKQEPGTENVWAPELFYDAAKGQWIIFWASTVPGKFSETATAGDHNHRIYCVTTEDFKTFSKTKLFYDGGFNVIDATLLAADGKFQLIVKDETKVPVKKNLRISVGDHADGSFGPAGEPIGTNWVEGPSAIRWGDNYLVYFDHYTAPNYYGAVTSTDLKHWRDISAQVSFPAGIRHGTVLSVPAAVVQKIQTESR